MFFLPDCDLDNKTDSLAEFRVFLAAVVEGSGQTGFSRRHRFG